MTGAEERGFSFGELLAVLLFVSVLGGLTLSWVRAVLHSARVQEVSTELQEAAVLAVDVIARELRMAGYDVAGSGLIAVRDAGRDGVAIVADLNGDGDTADAHEDIAYAYRPERRLLTRTSGAGRPQPLLGNVEGASFAFFDADGDELVLRDGSLPSGERARVRRIDLRLRVQRPVDAKRNTPLGTEVSTSICLRNQ